jgi:hypothetical protein
MKAALACLLCSCGGGMRIDDPIDEPETCVLDLALIGAVTQTIDDAACQGARDNGGDPIMAFVPTDHSMVMRVDVSFDAAFIGVTGSVPGELEVIDPNGFVWGNECSFQLEHWSEDGTKVGGSGTCPPLQPEIGGETISVAPFEFDVL